MILSSTRTLLTTLILGCTYWGHLWAQAPRVSEAEVNTQKVFIEANREKILGNYENAAYLYKEVLKKDGKTHAAYYELARIHDVLDQDSEALKAIQQAIKNDGSNAWYRMFLGDVYDKKRDYKGAARVYEDLIKDAPNQDYYYYKMAYYLVKAREANKAIKVYDQLEDIIGITAEVCQKKHRLYLGMGNSKKAALELQKLIDAYPSAIEHRHALASFYQQTTQTEKAQAEYRRILEVDPLDAPAQIALANFSKKSGKEVSYLQSLHPIFQQAELDIDSKIRELIPYIQKVAQTGDTELAAAGIQLAEILVEVHPQQAKSYSAYGDLLYYSNQKEKALAQYRQAIKLDDSVFPIWEQVMYIALETERPALLEEYAAEAIDLFPNQAKAYYFSGIAKEAQAQYRQAISEFQQALLMSRKKPQLQVDLYQRLGLAYHRTQNYEKADRAFEDALALNPKQPDVLYHYSSTLADRGVQLERAKQMAARCNELAPNRAPYQDAYGWVLYRLKDFEGAKEWIGKALKNGGQNDAGTLEHYGDVLAQLKDEADALRYWQKAASLGNPSEGLQKKISEAGGGTAQ